MILDTLQIMTIGGGWGVDKSLEGEYENELKIAKYGNE